MFEDSSWAIRIRNSKDRQHNVQKKKTEGQTTQCPKEKSTKNELQNITQKTKDRAI